MRVIGGVARGRGLRAPQVAGVRPTSDRVREAIFDVLGHLGGDDEVAGARVLDLFAGSGALGIEALSRGAASVVFVDSARDCLTMIDQNLAAVGLSDAPAELVRADALRFLTARRRFDLALVDPPYVFDRWAELLAFLSAPLVVLESNRPIDLGPYFQLHRAYRHGTTLVTVARRNDAEAADLPVEARTGEGDEELKK